MSESYIQDWCKIVDVSGYNILIEFFWYTDNENSDIHHVWAINISTELDKGRYNKLIFLEEDDSKKARVHYDNISKLDLAVYLSEWLEHNDNPNKY